MRLDFVKVFRDSTSEMLQQIVGPVDEMDSMSMNAAPLAGRDRTGGIDLDGAARGRVIFDMDAMTAVRLAGRLLEQPAPVLTPIAQSAISELASMIIGHAISTINDQGTHIHMDPPLIGDAGLARTENAFETLTFPVQTLFGE